jgi:hypothetical protein
MNGITPNMKQLLKNADLDRGVIDNVPHATARALQRRMLITDDWVKGYSAGGHYPRLHGIKLTTQGIRAAHEIKDVNR